MRRFALALLCAVAPHASACTPAPRPPHPSNAATAPASTRAAPVVIAMVIDQLAAWVADERLRELPDDGGFARLTREGARLREVHYAHAVTDTAPGHASLFTGVPPRVSGIFGNEVVDFSSGKRVSVLADDRVTLIGPTGPIEGARGSSPALLRADTVADVLRRSVPDAFIAGVSIKDRGAIFGCGRAPDACVWYDTARGAWVTSTAFARELPAWAKGSPVAALPREWTLLDPPWVKAHALTADDAPGEGDYGGLGVVFPHPLAGAREPNLVLRASPAADDAVLALGLAALGDPRARGRTTLLALSLSGNDYVGHAFGPDSWEAWDELRRLDAALARFFAALDARFGADGWAVVLSADHGVVPMPEARRTCTAQTALDHWQRPCDPTLSVGARILPDELTGDLQRAAARVLGPGKWVAGVADPYAYLTPDARALPAPRRTALLDALRAALLAHPGIAAVYGGRDDVPASCPPDADEGEQALVCRSRFPDRGGEIYIVPKRGSFFDPSMVVGKGTSHGTPYLFDRAVPLFARAPQRVPAGTRVETPVGFGVYARTIATLVGVEGPQGVGDGVGLVMAR